jgi:hypothetical protein
MALASREVKRRFFVGRCARKMPVIDDNLPWTLHRGQVVQSKRRALG